MVTRALNESRYTFGQLCWTAIFILDPCSSSVLLMPMLCHNKSLWYNATTVTSGVFFVIWRQGNRHDWQHLAVGAHALQDVPPNFALRLPPQYAALVIQKSWSSVCIPHAPRVNEEGRRGGSTAFSIDWSMLELEMPQLPAPLDLPEQVSLTSEAALEIADSLRRQHRLMSWMSLETSSINNLSAWCTSCTACTSSWTP